MKRNIFLIMIIIIAIVSIIAISVSNFKTKNIVSLNNNQKTNNLSIMLQDENGKYQDGDSSFNQEEYHFNSIRSKCLNGSKIKYDYDDKSIILNTTKSDRCYAYFDNNNFVEDLSGNGNHGKNKGALWLNDGLVSGDEEKYYGYVDCGLAEFDFKTDVSLIVRAKFNKFTNNEAMFGNWQGTGFGIYLLNNSFGFNLMGNLDKKYIGSNSDIKILDNTWHIFIGTYNGNNINLYIDGEKVKSQIVDDHPNIDVSVSPLSLGGDMEGSMVANPSYATYSEALIFDRELSEKEIAQDYSNKINPTNKEDLLLWYKFV